MRALLVLAAILFAAAPAAAERTRTGWNGQQGFSHYFPLSPEERARLMALQQSQRGGAAGGGVRGPQNVQTPQVCGWAGCAQGAAGGGVRGLQSAQTPQVCGWAGCQQGGATQIQQSRTDVCGWAGCAQGAAGGGVRGLQSAQTPQVCGWAGCQQGGATQIQQSRTDVCGWAGCR